jgi:hypothetical protein
MSVATTTAGLVIDEKASWRLDWAWGLPLILLTVILHAFGLVSIREKAVAIHARMSARKHISSTAAAVVIIGGVTVLATLLHGAEAGLWALIYLFIGALQDPASAVLYSLGALTTYGHQSVFLEPHWRLLGAIEALNGWLLFGLSTAFLFSLLEEISQKNRTSR